MGNNKPVRAVLTVLCLFALLLGMCGFALPCRYGDTFLGEMPYKQRILSETPGPRIIIIGGSSVPFGVNSELIETELPAWNVVDFGLYADLGIAFMLDMAAPHIREGDLIILSPEQDAQSLSCYVGAESAWQALDGDFSGLRYIKPSRWGSLLAAFPVFAGKKLHYTLFGMPEASGIYARSSFNSRGDIVSPLRSSNIMAGGYQSAQPVDFSADVISPELIEEINAFAKLAESRKAEVVYHFPPMNSAALVPDADIDAYYEYLCGALEIPVLGNPHSAVMDSGWFYDTNFHLNESGSTVFSRLLVEDIKLYLKDSSPTLIALPAMPAAHNSVIDGDNSCEMLFVYREDGEGLIISGLSAEGLSVQSLIIPVSHAGKNIVGIDSNVFCGNQAVREITVQENISSLRDAGFAGCTNLQRLILKAENPALCSVGDGLMQGASFRIAVPASALDAYRRSYFWQRYEPWIEAIS